MEILRYPFPIEPLNTINTQQLSRGPQNVTFEVYHSQEYNVQPVQDPTFREINVQPAPRRSILKNRKVFTVKVYLIAAIFLCLTAIQWISILTSPHLRDFFRRSSFFAFCCAIATLTFVSLFCCVDEIRYKIPYNWIFAILIVECWTYSVLQALLSSSGIQLLLPATITILTTVVFIAIGMLIPKDLTRDILYMAFTSIMTLIVLTIALIFVVVHDAPFPPVALMAIVVLLVILYIMYEAQIIAGDRVGQVQWKDYMLAALIVYVTVTTLFCLFTLMQIKLIYY